MKTSRTVFYPQDRDALGSTSVLSFAINRQATVTWTIRNAVGDVVDTRIADGVRDAGTHSFTFNGRTCGDGVLLPAGKYTSHVTATDGDFTVSQSVGFEMNAFAITSSTSTPKRGRSITITAKPAEAPWRQGYHVDLPAGQVGLDREDDEAVVGLLSRDGHAQDRRLGGDAEDQRPGQGCEGQAEQDLPEAAAS